MARFEDFTTALKNSNSVNENCVNKNIEDTTKRNKKFLSPVYHDIVYFGGHFFSLTVHREDERNFDYDYSNKTNFRELLKFMAEKDNNLHRN